jgi:DNA-binding HxlR family transcriptional regulator
MVGDRWSLLIVRDALDGVRRFGEFQSNLGIARNLLTTRLRRLVEHAILAVVPASNGSRYHEYALTDDGEKLHAVIAALHEWEKNRLASQDAEGQTDGSSKGPREGRARRNSTGGRLR